MDNVDKSEDKWLHLPFSCGKLSFQQPPVDYLINSLKFPFNTVFLKGILIFYLFPLFSVDNVDKSEDNSLYKGFGCGKHFNGIYPLYILLTFMYHMLKELFWR